MGNITAAGSMLVLSDVVCIILYLPPRHYNAIVNTRMASHFVVANSYKPLFATVTAWGLDPTYSDENMASAARN